jgi:site-specific DNA recombinase
MTDKLRFAPLVRVSTESQERMGESLRTQKSQIEQAVKTLNGVLIPDPWRYSGQEHSTPTFERKRFDQLLKDAGKGIFNAVIVVDPSRWSRDNLRSKQGLQVLKDHNIRFFTLQVEHDLFDPGAELFLGMATEFNEYSAKIQAKKSMRSRIARASDGRPTAGKLPFGRTYNKVTREWGIDEEKRKKILWAAKEYLKGGHLPKIAATLGLDMTTLWKILTKRSGPEWEIEFKSKKVGIEEKVILKVPPLLSPEMIRKIHSKAEANRTYTHGMIKHSYLLSRVVFCSRCGLAMFGQCNHSGILYYRHAKNLRQRECPNTHHLYVRADQLEEAVLLTLFSVFGDTAGMEKAMQRAIPDREKIEGLRERKKFLESEMIKVQTRKDRVIDSIAEGIISKEESAKRMQDIRSRESSIKEEIGQINPQLSDMPTREEIKGRAKMIQRILSQVYRTPSRLKKMSFEERRGLVSSFFSGKDAQGHRLGVYVKRDKDGTIHYEIRGVFQSFEGIVSPEGPDILSLPGVAVEHLTELKEAIRSITKEGVSQCHAYHGLSFYQR